MLVSAAAIGIAAPAFAQIPTIQAPVPVPTVQLPPVPTVRVPPVPTVRVPPVPTVRVPVPTPAAPAPQVPAPPPVTEAPPPVAGNGGSGGSAPSGGGGGGGAAPAGGGSAPSRASAGRSSSGGPAAGGAASAAAPSRGSSAAPRAARRRAPDPVRQRVERRERRLRETVVEASGCLDDLSAAQRRVLSLRAGVGAGPPRSRSRVARRLDISVRRVTRLERTGLRRLRALAKDGGCAPAAAPVASGAAGGATGAAGGAAASDGALLAATGGRESGGGSGGSGGESGGGSGGGEAPTGGVDTEDEGPASGGGVAGVTQTNQPAGESISLTIPLILLVLTLAAVLLARLLKRHMAPVAAVPVDDEPAPARPVWTPWRRSTMDGPGWNEAPPPSSEGSWASGPESEPPPPEAEHEPWSAPPSGRRALR
jgi:hypothetical protein